MKQSVFFSNPICLKTINCVSFFERLIEHDRAWLNIQSMNKKQLIVAARVNKYRTTDHF